MKAKSLITTGFMVLASSAAQAQSLGFGEITYAGNGCRPGTLQIEPSAAGLTLHFPDFQVAAGDGRGLDRKACNLAIPLDVPEGFKASLISTEYAGTTAIGPGAEVKFSAEHFFAGQQGPKLTLDFPAGSNGDFKIPFEVPKNETTFSGCGEDVILRTSVNIIAKSGEEHSAVSASLNKAAALKFLVIPCDAPIPVDPPAADPVPADPPQVDPPQTDPPAQLEPPTAEE